MSVLALLTGGEAEERFEPMEIGGEWTVWDAEDKLYVVHEAEWDAETAQFVAERLAEVPSYVSVWTWADAGAVRA